MMKLQEAVKLLRACDVQRWTIVQVTRRQTVAEHQYRVWVLALSLYDHLMGGTPHNSFEREAVGFWALVHDADEIWTGDLPSPIKTLLEEISPGILKKVKERVLSEHLPTIAASMRGLETTFAAAIVKIAECVEAANFYSHNSYNGRNRELVIAFLNGKLRGELEAAVAKYPSVPFSTTGNTWVLEAMGSI